MYNKLLELLKTVELKRFARCIDGDEPTYLHCCSTCALFTVLFESEIKDKFLKFEDIQEKEYQRIEEYLKNTYNIGWDAFTIFYNGSEEMRLKKLRADEISKDPNTKFNPDYSFHTFMEKELDLTKEEILDFQTETWNNHKNYKNLKYHLITFMENKINGLN